MYEEEKKKGRDFSSAQTKVSKTFNHTAFCYA